jgi:MFS family permease
VTAPPAAPTRWQQHAGGLPRAFWVLWWGTLVNRLGGFVQPLLALYLTQVRDVSITRTGLVLTLFGLGGALSQPLGGVLADRIGRRRTMVLGLLSSAASLLVLGAVRSLFAISVAVVVYGLCLDLFRPASRAAVVDLVPPADLPRAVALNFWAINLGFAVATPLAGALAVHGYWWLFALDAATCVAFAAVLLRGVPETRPVRDDTPGSMRDVLADRLMLALCLGTLLQAVVYLQAFVTLPLAFTADELSTASYGAVLGLNGLLIIVLQPLLLGVLAGRADRLLLWAGALQGVGFGATALADDLVGHIAALTVWTVGEVLAAGVLGALVGQLAPAQLRGRYMGVHGLSYGVAGLLAPLLGTQLLARAGEPWLWGSCLVLCAVSGVLLAGVSRAAADRPAPV